MGCHFLPPAILPTQGLNPNLLYWRAVSLLPLSHQRNVLLLAQVVARAAQWAGGSIFQLQLMRLSSFRVISLFHQIFSQNLLCLGICRPFLGSWKINPTWFLPSDGSQESSTRTKRALSLRTSRGQHEISEAKRSAVAQSCPTLCTPMDCSPPSSSVHGILQLRILEWVAISFF